jgi:CheY-like chemotaxis protein
VAADHADRSDVRRSPILCVDDDLIARRLYASLFARSGFPCVCAREGREALAFLADDPARYGLVITDHDMPGLDGLGLLEAMRRLGVAAKVVVVSAGVPPECFAAYRRLGVEKILIKPFENQALLALAAQLSRPGP